MMKWIVTILIALLLIVQITVTVSQSKIERESENALKNIEIQALTDFQWSMCGHDAQNTGQSQYAASQNEGYEKWKYFVDTSLEIITPVIDINGTLYIGVENDGLHAIYQNGTQKWHRVLEGFFMYQPVIGLDGTIYIGSNNRFYAVYPNGTLRWTLPIGGDVCGLPIVSPENIIYVGTSSGFLYAIYPNGTIQWEYYFGYRCMGVSLDLVGNIYYTAVSPCDYLYCLSPNGTLRWAFETINDVWDAPLIGDDGTIYVVAGTIAFAITPNGTEKWRTQVGNPGYGPSLSPDGTIVYSSLAEDVFGLDPNDGHIRWQYQLSFNPTDKSRPAISSDGIIFFSYTDKSGDNAYLSALNPDGTLKWTMNITSDIYPYDGASVGPLPSIAADGTVFVTTWFYRGGSIYTDFGYVHAFGQLDADAPTAPTITGSLKGKVGEPHEYTFTSTSPPGKNLFYYVYWGDETYTNWTGPFPSGEPIRINHSWSKWGRYTIQARARDSDNLWGPWGELKVTMPKNKGLFITHPILNWLLERFPHAFPILRYILNIN